MMSLSSSATHAHATALRVFFYMYWMTSKDDLIHAADVLTLSSAAAGLLAGEHVHTPVHLCWAGIEDWHFADKIIAGSGLVCSLEIDYIQLLTSLR